MLGDTRVVMRGPMFPNLLRLPDGAILLTAGAREEHSETVSIRSEDGGETWRPWTPAVPAAARHAAITLSSGRVLATSYRLGTVPGDASRFQMARWESFDGWRSVSGPAVGSMSWPAGVVIKAAAFYGTMIEVSGTLLATMQGRGPDGRFRTFLVRSEDGAQWEYVALVASLDTIDDLPGTTRTGWQLHGPCEGALAQLDDGRLLCALRLVDDDDRPLMGPARTTYRDLAREIPGSAVYPGDALPADCWYSAGPPSPPIILTESADRGRSWSRARPLVPARGCYPRLARCGDVILLTYGALSFPRWGNALTVSTDGGCTWSDEVIFAAHLTTGYTDVVRTGERRFLIAFDATPPQPWKEHAAHWVGVVDVSISV